MSRHLIVLRSEGDRERVAKYAKAAPPGTRVEFKATKRSLPQNDRMWAMLTDVAVQKQHCGRKYTPETWKSLFMHACGHELQPIPALDGNGVIPWGYRSSDLSKGEMSDLIEFIHAWGAQNDVTFHDPTEPPSWEPLGGPPIVETPPKATEVPSTPENAPAATPEALADCRTSADYIAYAEHWINTTADDRAHAQGRWDNELDTRQALKVPVVERVKLQARIDKRYAK